MALCITFEAGGLGEHPGTAPEACAGYMLVSGGEYQLMTSTPWALSVEEAAALGGALIALWGLAAIFRVLCRQTGEI